MALPPPDSLRSRPAEKPFTSAPRKREGFSSHHRALKELNTAILRRATITCRLKPVNFIVLLEINPKFSDTDSFQELFWVLSKAKLFTHSQEEALEISHPPPHFLQASQLKILSFLLASYGPISLSFLEGEKRKVRCRLSFSSYRLYQHSSILGAPMCNAPVSCPS